MNADYFPGCERSRPCAALFIGLGILLQGELQQPVGALQSAIRYISDI
jgi:hypothetical protein